MADFEGKIEVVRGRMTEDRADQILRVWSSEGALEGDAARRRLPEVVCVLLDGEGEIAGVNSVSRESVALIGGRSFWVYRRLLLPTASEMEAAMVNAAFTALEEGFDRTAAGPIGLYVLIGDRAEMERHPEAIWPDTELKYAGYLADGRQARIRYFYDATIGPGFPNSPSLDDLPTYDFTLEDRYRIEPFGAGGEVTPDDVLALWKREGAMPAAEAQRRVHEVKLVALEEKEGIVGVGSAYLKRNRRLRTDLWHFRTFVASKHRHSSLALNLGTQARDLLEQRFVSGQDTRAPGIMYEIENEGLRTYFNTAEWVLVGATFIGENARGDHVYVQYFPGALAPVPGSAPAA